MLFESELVFMLKTLQTYTICIVILVVVLSQFSLLSNSSTSYEGESTNNYSKEKLVHYNNEFIDTVKSSKYAESVGEIQKIMHNADNFMKELQKNINQIKELLDVEKQINELYDLLE